MNDKRTHGTDPEDDPALTALLADLHAAHATPLPVPLRTAIGLALREQMHAQAGMENGVIATAPPTARGTTVVLGTHRRKAQRSSRRAGPALFAAALVAICLILLAVLTRSLIVVTPATRSIPIPAVFPATGGWYSSAICGYRVTVTRAYADANRVFVGYTVVPPTGRRFLDGFYDNAQLRTASGTALRGAGSGSAPEAQGDRFTPLGRGGGTEQLDTFETARDDPRARRATFLLSIPALLTTEFAGTTPGMHACERYGASGAGIRRVTVAGPFTVRFTVPVQPARRASLHWPIGSGRDREVVERIVVTPSETRIYLRGSGLYRPQIAISGVRPYHGPNDSWRQGAETVIVYDDQASYFPSLYRKPNPWTLAVLGGSSPGNDGDGSPFATVQVNLS